MLVQWFNSLPVASQAALIGAVIGALGGALANIMTGVLRDFIAKLWTDRREAAKSADEVYRRYAEPLASAVTSLLWRLKEMLGHDGRASYLLSQDPKTVFEDYKLRSTYYRLAAVLGWVRALRRELSFFRRGAGGRLDEIEDAIANLEASLADGHHVELQRLDGLLQIWGLPPIRDSQLRLQDVLALIQVLGLNEHSHRSDEGLVEELSGAPRSEASWIAAAEDHPEFFRVRAAGEHRVSLVALHAGLFSLAAVIVKTNLGQSRPPG